MKLLTLVVAISMLAGAGLSACSAVEKAPTAAIDDGIESRIAAAGGTPGDWDIENGCVVLGACTATLALARQPASVLATNHYVSRDSRAFLYGEDRIARTVDLAYSRRCLERFTRIPAQLRCLDRGYDLSTNDDAAGGIR